MSKQLCNLCRQLLLYLQSDDMIAEVRKARFFLVSHFSLSRIHHKFQPVFHAFSLSKNKVANVHFHYHSNASLTIYISTFLCKFLVKHNKTPLPYAYFCMCQQVEREKKMQLTITALVLKKMKSNVMQCS